MSDYVPPTNEVRSAYAWYICTVHSEITSESRKAARAEFDRWLAAHEQSIRTDERERTREGIAEEIRAQKITCPVHGIPDCSAPLNGCRLPAQVWADIAQCARLAERWEPES